MRVVSCLLTEHDLWLVVLAAVVCTLGAVITFRLFSRAWGRKGPQVKGWVFLTSIAAGSATWCTHFIAMLAYESNAPVTYQPILTLVSLAVAIAGSGLSFALASYAGRNRAYSATAGAMFGLTVSAMHYVGMAAYHVAGDIEWDTAHVIASIALSSAFGALSLVSFTTAQRQDRTPSHAAVWMICAVVSLHFTAMAAVQVTPMAVAEASTSSEAAESIAVAVAGAALLILGTGLVSYIIDEQVEQETIERLKRLAHSDSLTELPNRIHFNKHFIEELDRAREHETRLACILIDLDNFKELNDQFGHKAGDQALQVMAARFAAMIQPGEFVARIGGDEFTALKRYDDISEVHEFVARLQAALGETITLSDITTELGGSVGVALFPDDGVDAPQLLGHADLAMYRAKGDPARTVCFYDKEMDAAVRDRALLSADLRSALQNNELVLFYQVQRDIQTNEVIGYEALLRWRHPVRGMILPADFIPLAEANGLIVEIGDWVLRRACSRAASWSRPHKIAVNISGVQLRRGDLDDVIRAVLEETRLDPSRLEIEITESSLVEDKDQALQTLQQIRALGVAVVLDDLGAGYASLGTLRTFSFDKIKLDRSFTSTVEPQSLAIVRAIIALGDSLKIRVLAEGVETEEQLAILRFEGCHEAQGYFLGRPAPEPALISAELVEWHAPAEERNKVA